METVALPQLAADSGGMPLAAGRPLVARRQRYLFEGIDQPGNAGVHHRLLGRNRTDDRSRCGSGISLATTPNRAACIATSRRTTARPSLRWPRGAESAKRSG
jgi:hypothetical protein